MGAARSKHVWERMLKGSGKRAIARLSQAARLRKRRPREGRPRQSPLPPDPAPPGQLQHPTQPHPASHPIPAHPRLASLPSDSPPGAPRPPPPPKKKKLLAAVGRACSCVAWGRREGVQRREGAAWAPAGRGRCVRAACSGSRAACSGVGAALQQCGGVV